MFGRIVYERLSHFKSSKLLTRILWKDISDEQTRLLHWLIPGWTNPGNLLCFQHAVSNLPNGAPIVEIGSFCGLSANLLSYYKQQGQVKNRLITCDNWTLNATPRAAGHSRLTELEVMQFIKESYIRSIKAFSGADLPFGVEMVSHDFFSAWRRFETVPDVIGRSVQLGGPISFCFIDGGHDYQTVKRDFEDCHHFLERDGFILFDDSSIWSAHEGVRRLVREVKSRRDYRVVMKNPNYLFQKK
ncbi:MAG: class I SAM-dependent methyltransferase [Desulfomonilaceae bacterium]